MQQVARTIEHTLLKPEATEADIRRLVAEAHEHQFAAVCVNGRWLRLVSELLAKSGPDWNVHACGVVGFPLGAMAKEVKSIEAIAAMKDGASEIDMVIALDTLLEGKLDQARADIHEVVRAVRAVRREALVKVILETAALTEEQVALGCRAAAEASADFVKTSTGFHPKGGATVQAVEWLAKYGKPLGLKVKASGGIRDWPTAKQMLAAGADRLGTSSGVAILAAAETEFPQVRPA